MLHRNFMTIKNPCKSVTYKGICGVRGLNYTTTVISFDCTKN